MELELGLQILMIVTIIQYVNENLTVNDSKPIEKFVFLIILVGIGVPFGFAYGINYYDLDLIELKVVDIQILSMDDTPDFPLDDSDLLKVTINVTNNSPDNFLVQDKMFKIWVLVPNFMDNNNEVFEMVDNYYTSYDDELEVRYDKLNSRELFNECDYTNDRIKIGQSKVFTVCYDVLRSWANQVLDIDDQKRYYLVMMDNYKATSCPNCKKVLLSTPSESDQKHHIPDWIQNILEWHKQGLISDHEYQNSIEYLIEMGIITEDAFKKEIQLMLAEKNMQLKDHQAKLLLAQQTNLYVSSMKFYESKYNDEFSGVLCKKQNNIVTLSGDYTNDGIYYYTVFFKLILFDEFGNVVASGLSKIVDVTSKDFRNFSVSTPYKGNIDQCLVMVDSKFIPN